HINQIIRQDNIDILAVQETHLTPEKTSDLENRYKRLSIHSSYDPERINSKGVAILINKHRMRWKEAETHDLIQGRAILTTIPWKQNEEKLSILAIYAPNESDKQVELWEKLNTIMETNQEIPKPHILIGDFNVVESAIDRLPPSSDPKNAVESLQAFRMKYNLQDVWRNENPSELAYTYVQFQQRSRKSQSRIDRIYIKGELAPKCQEWKSKHPGITSDHKITTVKIENPKAPYIGKGRWAMPHFITEDREIMRKINEIGENKLEQIEKTLEGREHQPNKPRTSIQELHEEFKEQIQKEIRNHVRTAIPKLEKTIQTKEKQLKEI
ncbi:Endonuclease/exonuclease/phosphatase, partial [Panaeolus papilionaceus]